MGTSSLQQLLTALQNSWSAQTSFTPTEWSTENPARGQCLVSTFVVQDYFGGDLRRYDVKADNLEETHYCNVLPDGTVLDVTAMQYTQLVELTVTPINLCGHATARERYMADPDTQAKYELLSARIRQALSQ